MPEPVVTSIGVRDPSDPTATITTLDALSMSLILKLTLVTSFEKSSLYVARSPSSSARDASELLALTGSESPVIERTFC